MSRHQRTHQECQKILEFIVSNRCAVSTGDVSRVLGISLYRARYYLRQLVLLGAVYELNQGRGRVSRWRRNDLHLSTPKVPSTKGAPN